MAGRRVDRWWFSALLWVLAVVLMLSAASWQRRTGPTYPARGQVTVEGGIVPYELVRSATTGAPARVAVPDPDVPATLVWRRYPTDDPWTEQPMRQDDGELLGLLPSQPPAGKLEYHVRFQGASGPVVVPVEESAVIRFKGEVPAGVLAPHVIAMFLGMLVGVRALLEALAGRRGVRWLTWLTLALIAVGGMVLGPIVQEHAFGEYWTGVPWGWDLTDNKTLVMFLAWIGAAIAVGLRGDPGRRARLAVVAAGLVMVAVYLVPHSMHGSELDHDAVDQGIDPAEAIGQG